MQIYRFLAPWVAIAALALITQQSNAETTVTLALDNVTLKSLVNELTSKSGVKHQVIGREAEQQRVAVFCKDQPVAAVRAALTETIGWEWVSEANDGQVRYTLIKGVRLRNLERSLRAGEQQRYLEIVHATIQKARKPEEAENSGGALDLQARDSRTAGLLQALGELPAEMLESLVGGKQFSGPTSNWPTGFTTRVSQWSKESGSTPEGIVRPGDRFRLSVPKDQSGRPLWVQFTHARGKRELAEMRLALAEWARDEEISPLAPSRNRLAELVRENPSLGKPLDSVSSPKWPAPPEHPTFVGWQLRDLSRRTAFPLIADVYPEMERTTQSISFNKPPFELQSTSGRGLYQVLNRIGQYSRYHWDVQNGWVIMRFRDWYWEPLRQPGD